MKQDRRWVWLPLVLGLCVAKNELLTPRVDWNLEEWAMVEIPLTAALLWALCIFGAWLWDGWRERRKAARLHTKMHTKSETEGD